jgi:hypothetical protein
VPAQTTKRRTGLKAKSPRPGVPLPGIGGYDYPRGPYGATGFPGSTPAAAHTHAQTEQGRKDRQLTTTQTWARDTGPEFTDPAPTVVPRPQPSYSQVEFLPGTEPGPGNRFLRGNGSPRQPYARTHRGEHAGKWRGETGPEQRMTPVIGGSPGSQNVRNTFAQRYKAVPGLVRAYRAAPNPGKTGAQLDAPSRYHPGTMVHGHPDGKPVPGMAPQPGYPPMVNVPSRYVSAEGSQEGYAMNRPLLFAKGGVAPYPSSFVRFTGNQHLRGARLTGQRYFGDLADQQRIGLPSDAYGIARARGPRHRPVQFQQPAPWTANYYDTAPEVDGDQAGDMIHVSPTRPRAGRAVRRG